MVVVASRRVVAVDGNILDHGVVVAVLHVRTAPVNLTTSPLDSTLSVASLTSRPQRELNSGRSLRVVVLAGSLVVGLVAVESTKDLAINLPAERVGLPVDCVSVPLRVSVGRRKVLFVSVCESIS